MITRFRFILTVLAAATLVAAVTVEAQHIEKTALTGAWQVVELNNTTLPDTAGVTLEFDVDGRIVGRSGCNRYFGSYTQTAGALAFGAVAMTKIACPAPQIEIEARFTQALAHVVHAATDDSGALILTDVNGQPMIKAVTRD